MYPDITNFYYFIIFSDAISWFISGMPDCIFFLHGTGYKRFGKYAPI